MFHNDLVGQSEAAPAYSKAEGPAEPWDVPLEASAAAGGSAPAYLQVCAQATLYSPLLAILIPNSATQAMCSQK